MNRPGEFLDHVITQFLVRMHERPANNYDAARFSFDGVDRSSEFSLAKHKNYLYFFLQSHEALHESYLLLEDEQSRKTFVDLILYRLAGHLHVKLDANNPTHWALREGAEQLDSNPSAIEHTGAFGPLAHFENVDFEGNKISFDGWHGNIAWSFLFKQYYLQRNGACIRPEPGDHVIDAGACFGDTALGFAATVGPAGRVYAFDVLENHLAVIRHNIAQNPELAKRIDLFAFALGDTCNAAARPIESGHRLAPGFSLNGISEETAFPVRTIDGLVESGEVERVNFIKMDIEGYELRALQGAVETIRTFRPKLAVSIYHKSEDMYQIPIFIHRLGLGYKMHIEHYTIHAEETILYAVV